MKATRQDVFDAISSEREYQEQLPRIAVHDQRPLEQAALIRHLLTEMDLHWYTTPGEIPMSFFRKIAAIAVRCMEQHGAPQRGDERNG